MNIRTVDIQEDRTTLLDFHCVTNYESGNPSLRKAYAFEQFRDIWMKSRGPDEFLSALEASLKDPRTIAEIWEDDAVVVAYIWVKFLDWPEYHSTGAEINDIIVTPAFRRQGIATDIIKRVERLARERGATLLRSGTGAENVASQGLHAKLGFKTSWLQYDKEL